MPWLEITKKAKQGKKLLRKTIRNTNFITLVLDTTEICQRPQVKIRVVFNGTSLLLEFPECEENVHYVVTSWD